MEKASKELSMLDKLQPLFLITSIFIGLIISKLFPTFSSKIVPVVSIGIFLVILLIMISVDIKGILDSFKKWNVILIAIIINFLFTPFFANFLGVVFLKNDPGIHAGLILYLITPCIGWYLVFTELAGGNVELGIVMLAWNIILQLALIPVYMWIFTRKLVGLNIASILYSVGIFLFIPFILSRILKVIISKKFGSTESFSEKFKISYLKTIILGIVIISMFASQGEILFQNPLIVVKMILPGLVYFITIFVIALFIGIIFKIKYKDVALLSFTLTARNSEASLAIAVSAFTNPLIPLTVVIGPSIELPILIFILNILKVIKRKGLYVE